MNPPPLDAAEFRRLADVSRETLARLQIYSDLLAKWQRRINLVSRASLADIWRRHMLDSAQLVPLMPEATGARREIVDLGSGAGFPGLVLAIMGAGSVHLIEADGRKCAFLREAARLTETKVTVHRARIEDLAPWPADIVTARALAPLPRLFDQAAPFLDNLAGNEAHNEAGKNRPKGRGESGIGLFLKGARMREELTEAAKDWSMGVEQFRSRTDPAGVVLRIRGLMRG